MSYSRTRGCMSPGAAMTQLLHRFLGTGDALARLQDHAQRLRRLQGALDAALPTPMIGQCEVANLKDGTLVVAARSGAAAVRLKQMLPSLIEHLGRSGHAVQAIRVKVSAPAAAELARAPSERHISETAKAELSAFAASLPADSPLRTALARLVARGR